MERAIRHSELFGPDLETRSRPSVEIAPAPSAPAQPGPAPDISVLIFGTHALAVDGLRHRIEVEGQPVISTTLDPAELMAEVRRRAVDVVIFDLYHRSEAEFELASSIRRVSRKTQILFLIDEPTVDELRLAIRHGVIGFYRKKSPKPVALIEMIRRVARGEALIEGSLLTTFLAALGPHETGPTAAEMDVVSRLSKLDREVLARTATGRSSREIAAELGFSAGFIRNRLSAVYGTIGVSNKTQAVVFAVRTGITNL